ncbi:hypothetical protein D5S18_16610 [Nocardia panacis]|uniref:DUF3592 domain-containing protein n=1 Tax=Nocardia panacis TaxID=2340916 RepID=A0A3A4KLW8_9NOCA|nr:hypothetical protein [Nocardia panacis]RJO75016.1 hypothetical protein D5S18_16610 [Nocardia panacis]
MVQFVMLLIVAGAVTAMVVAFLRSRGKLPQRAAQTGTLYVTGVSPRPEGVGEQFVTLTGNLTGPNVPGAVVYGRFVWGDEPWPAIGDLLRVAYPAGNPNSFQIVGSA